MNSNELAGVIGFSLASIALFYFVFSMYKMIKDVK